SPVGDRADSPDRTHHESDARSHHGSENCRIYGQSRSRLRPETGTAQSRYRRHRRTRRESSLSISLASGSGWSYYSCLRALHRLQGEASVKTRGEQFAGLTVALVTPFKNGDTDFDELRRLVDWHIEQGTDCLAPVGTTGESPTLPHEEHERIIAAVCEYARER